ncbi:hypothetical protein [Streptomyces sp. NPDC127190]|uniref:WXG100 family type VII secretion target n=1 Tax=unclassified Streptomyces TaxID=2593676 RepID=UPI003644071E
MSKASNRPEPQLAHTDFESMTHEQLAAMLDSASTAGASHLSTKLAKAATTITKIGDDLMQHVKNLEWQGEAGDAFRDWGGQTASATLRLGEYAAVASSWMGTVSQAISEAKAAMPDVSETTQAKTDLANAHATIAAAKQPGAHNDPDAQQQARTAKADATAAQQRIEAARGEAIQQMRKLAQTYEYSAQQVNSVTPPTFSPPSNNLNPKQWAYDTQHIPTGSNASAPVPRAQTAGSLGGSPSSQHHNTSQVAAPRLPHTTEIPVTPVHTPQSKHHAPPVDMGIDSADTLPRTSHDTVSPPVPRTNIPHRELQLPDQPTAVPPTFSGGGRGLGSAPLPRVSTPGRLPQMPGAVRPTGGVPHMPRETGIVGGRPVTNTGRPTSGLPRGTVIGKESTQARAPMGRTMTPSSPSGGSARPGGGLVGGRRLASEEGGVVGGRPGQPGGSSGRPFTTGGSGLVRPPANGEESLRRSTAGRATGSPQQPGTRKSQQQNGQRPDYLVEDEETWTRDNRRPLPPVVD